MRDEGGGGEKDGGGDGGVGDGGGGEGATTTINTTDGGVMETTVTPRSAERVAALLLDSVCMAVVAAARSDMPTRTLTSKPLVCSLRRRSAAPGSVVSTSLGSTLLSTAKLTLKAVSLNELELLLRVKVTVSTALSSLPGERGDGGGEGGGGDGGSGGQYWQHWSPAVRPTVSTQSGAPLPLLRKSAQA